MIKYALSIITITTQLWALFVQIRHFKEIDFQDSLFITMGIVILMNLSYLVLDNGSNKK